MSRNFKRGQRITFGIVCTMMVMINGCSANNSDVVDPDADTMEGIDAVTGTDALTDTDTDTDTDTTQTFSAALSCEEIAAAFKTNGSANADLPDPEVSASCVDDSVVITSNQIPDFPYIETSPGSPEEYDLEYTIPAVPTVAESVSDIPALGALGMAINGIPIYGATEGTGGDVLSLAGGFTECGAHNGPTGYHYHTFDVTGSDYCLFSEAEASAQPQLFGIAFDGFPIYSGNFQYTSSWYLSDASLFATDTFSAHTFAEGSGDLDQCNGRTDADGNYAYYTTDEFPYTLGCYRGVVSVDTSGTGTGTGTGPGTGPGPGPGPGQ